MTAFTTLEREAPALVPPPPTAPTARRRRRLLLTGAGLLALLIAAVAITAGQSAGGTLDPRSAGPTGARALATLLGERGVTVTRGTAASPGRTVFVPFPQALTDAELDALLRSGADVVLADPGPVTAAQFAPAGSVSVRTRPPSCGYRPATVAGSVQLGGTQYVSGTSGTVAVSCYDRTLVALPSATAGTGGRVVVLGSASFMTNEHLDKQGNAALALGLLSAHPQLTWYTARRAAQGASLTDLLPRALLWAGLQLLIAVAFVGWWRGRRLGPVVTEPLPVVVRAAETVLGRARLYAAARARTNAAEGLRAGTRARLASALHQDAFADPAAERQALVAEVARRTGRPPGPVADLLYGGPGQVPGSDQALVGLADELDGLERAATGERAFPHWAAPPHSPREDTRP